MFGWAELLPRSTTEAIMAERQITIHEVRESYGSDFYVYAGSSLIRTCPSLGMAREVAAGLQ
jgi:hypothetical protein